MAHTCPCPARSAGGPPGRWKQHAVDTYIVDFFCAKSKLVIEVDGDSHAEQMEYDAARTQWLNEQHHYRVLRFTNREVLTNIEAVIAAIRAAL